MIFYQTPVQYSQETQCEEILGAVGKSDKPTARQP